MSIPIYERVIWFIQTLAKLSYRRPKLELSQVRNTPINMNENLMLELFLDTLTQFARENPDLLTPHTQQMADDMDKLLAGVTVDE